MEEILKSADDVSAITVLVALIVGFLTKRIVPYWVHEDVVTRLKRYELAAPDLIAQLQRFFDEQDDADPPPRTRTRSRPFAALKTQPPVRKGPHRPQRRGGKE